MTYGARTNSSNILYSSAGVRGGVRAGPGSLMNREGEGARMAMVDSTEGCESRDSESKTCDGAVAWLARSSIVVGTTAMGCLASPPSANNVARSRAREQTCGSRTIASRRESTAAHQTRHAAAAKDLSMRYRLVKDALFVESPFSLTSSSPRAPRAASKSLFRAATVPISTQSITSNIVRELAAQASAARRRRCQLPFFESKGLSRARSARGTGPCLPPGRRSKPLMASAVGNVLVAFLKASHLLPTMPSGGRSASDRNVMRSRKARLVARSASASFAGSRCNAIQRQ
mmetsp:Transcript_21765/g.56817  ORF Transcript_21765/g.56817 Transcript_21765/m.56817 type:complete len:288 (-) Transcript_21765:578-1441(-)